MQRGIINKWIDIFNANKSNEKIGEILISLDYKIGLNTA
jgi:hypothetical protein